MSMFKSKRRQSELKGGKRRHGSPFLNHRPPNQTGVEGNWMVGVCARHVSRVCCLCSTPLAIRYLPSPRVVSSLSQARAGAARENGRKSDPYGGTIKPTADLQSSSKPGQDFINTVILLCHLAAGTGGPHPLLSSTTASEQVVQAFQIR